MDSGEGRFIQDDLETLREMKEKMPDAGGIFSKGELLEIRGSIFKVRNIGKKYMTLELRRRDGN